MKTGLQYKNWCSDGGFFNVIWCNTVDEIYRQTRFIVFFVEVVSTDLRQCDVV